MSFYESISEYYDRIFPPDPEAVDFLARRAPVGSPVLDVACGTGSHALALAARGLRVTGIDLDPAMVAAARRKAAAAGAPGAAAAPAGRAPRFEVLDMRRVRRSFQPGFGLVFCVGNSLVHLRGQRPIAAFLRDCHALLQSGGCLVVQIIHYDRLLEQGITELPTLRDGELEFRRRYEYASRGRVVRFRTQLLVSGPRGQRRIENCVPLWVLKRAALEELALRAGFRDLRLFGGFDEKPLGPHSLPLILCGVRP